jgi:hypothetical protein
MVHTNRHHKQLIFCVSQIVSVSIADTENWFPADTTNIFYSNVNLQNILKAIECGDIDTEKGLNQDMKLAQYGQTRWKGIKFFCFI